MTLIVGVYCTDGIVVVADRIVTQFGGRRVELANKLVSGPGWAAGVAGNAWDCKEFLRRAEQIDLAADVRAELHRIILATRASDHSGTYGPDAPLRVIPSVKVMLATSIDGHRGLWVSRRSEPFARVEGPHIIGDDNDAIRRAASECLGGPLARMEAVVKCWRFIRVIEASEQHASIGLGGEPPGVLMVDEGGNVSCLSPEVSRTIHDAIERASQADFD